MNASMFNGTNLPHELLLTTRQATKLRNAIESNMSQGWYRRKKNKFPDSTELKNDMFFPDKLAKGYIYFHTVKLSYQVKKEEIEM